MFSACPCRSPVPPPPASPRSRSPPAGGGVSANPSPIVDSPDAHDPARAAVMYSGLPTTFVLSGGTGSYIVTSSNQAMLPVAAG